MGSISSSGEQTEMARFLQRLVQTPSISGQEGDVAVLIESQLHETGVEDVRVDSIGNVVARLGAGEGPTLLYDTHMDTVSATDAEWLHDPFAGIIEDGVLYGLGAGDAKGSIVALAQAARRLVESRARLDGQLVLAFMVQHEPCEGCALKLMLEEMAIRPDWVVVTEPSNLQIMRGHRGRVMLKVTTHGRGSHASNPDLGDNAISAAIRLIFGIDMLTTDLAVDPFLGSGTVAVTHIESQGASLNAIPNSCTFYVDRRLTLGESATRASAEIEGIIGREGLDAAVEIVERAVSSYTGYELCVREAFNAWALEPGHPLIQELGRAAQDVLGQVPEVGRWDFSTDGAYSMGEMDIPTVGFGPGDPAHAHTIHDQVRLDDVARAAQVYANLAVTLLGG